MQNRALLEITCSAPPRINFGKAMSNIGGIRLQDAALELAERNPPEVDVIHCHDWMTVLAGIKLRSILGKPLVYNVHLPQALDAYQGLEKLGLVSADLVLVNSEAVEKEIRAHATCYRTTRNVAFTRAVAYHDDEADPIATSLGTFMLGTKPGKAAT